MIKFFPKSPGVYLFKDAKGAVIYVGKAKNLRSRVASYFKKGRDERPQIKFLIKRARTIDYIITGTEKEALLLENTLIKEHRPRYNISLRDDKGYVSIRIGSGHKFPAVSLTRKIKKDGAEYFGPYDQGLAAREAVELIQRYFRVRSCTDTEFANRVRPCLKYDIGRCTAPCVDRISEKEYSSQVDEARLFLSGRSKELIHKLESNMQKASENLAYEEAARLRDVIAMLKGMIESQSVVRHGGGDIDAVAASIMNDRAVICVLKIRGGALISKRIFNISGALGVRSKLIEEFLLTHYREKLEIPGKIALSDRPEAMGVIENILGDRVGAKIALRVPVRGDMRRLVELADTNAKEALLKKAGRTDEAVMERIGKIFALGHPLNVIECVDISNLSGREAVGSLVQFADGEPNKSGYRIYNIRTLTTPDDYAMMKEVLERRFRIREDISKTEAAQERLTPDLLLVDGGKGQLNVAKLVLDELGLSLPLAAIAKGEKKGHADQIFIPGRKNPLNFKRGSKELLFFMRVRDEAHRFGINAHRRKRQNSLNRQNSDSGGYFLTEN